MANAKILTVPWTNRLPTRSPETAPFWDACNRGEFLLQSCTQCGQVQYHYRAICASCWTNTVEDFPAAGTGTVWTFSVVRVSRSEFGSKDAYVVVLVELDEGVRVFGNLVECAPEDVAIGAPVELAFAVAEDGQHIPVFTPRA